MAFAFGDMLVSLTKVTHNGHQANASETKSDPKSQFIQDLSIEYIRLRLQVWIHSCI